MFLVSKNENWARARRYNEEVEQCCQEKEARLLEFQQEVKSRVKQIGEEKQQALHAKTSRDVSWLAKIYPTLVRMYNSCYE